jgi:hypothetical protein
MFLKTGEKGNNILKSQVILSFTKIIKFELMDLFTNHPLYRKHNIDSAMNSLWAFYKKNFLVLFITSFVMSLVLQYLSTMISIKDLQSVTDPMEMLEKLKGILKPIAIIALVTFLFSTILHHYILYNPVDSQNNIFVSVKKSPKYFIPYIIVLLFLAFAGSFAVVLGILALFIGVFFSLLYVMTLHLFILPLMMVEGPDIGNTIKRMFRLTHRSFWSNMGWGAVFLIISLVISVIISGIILLLFSGSFLKIIANPEIQANAMDFGKNPVFIILSALGSALTFPVMPIFACILYFNGRAGEDQVQKMSVENPDNIKVKVEDLYAKPYADDHPDNPDKTGEKSL